MFFTRLPKRHYVTINLKCTPLNLSIAAGGKKFNGGEHHFTLEDIAMSFGCASLGYSADICNG
jgi:hypothetical protein